MYNRKYKELNKNLVNFLNIDFPFLSLTKINHVWNNLCKRYNSCGSNKTWKKTKSYFSFIAKFGRFYSRFYFTVWPFAPLPRYRTQIFYLHRSLIPRVASQNETASVLFFLIPYIIKLMQISRTILSMSVCVLGRVVCALLAYWKRGLDIVLLSSLLGSCFIPFRMKLQIGFTRLLRQFLK